MRSEQRFSISKQPSLRGQLLIASPMLRGTPFDRAVVLVLQDDEQGVFGVVLNRPANEKVRDAWREISGDSETGVEHLSLGGPLAGPIFVIHPIEALGELQVDGNVYLTAAAESINEIIQSGNDQFRIFFGLAGWKRDQLQEEMDSGSWYSMPSDATSVFDDSPHLWEMALLEYGRRTMQDILGVKMLPRDPNLN